MALKVGELFASLNLKDEGFSSGLSSAEAAMNSAAQNMQKGSDSVFKGLLKMDIFKKVAGAVMGAGKSIMAVGQSFESTMSAVGALSGAGAEDMARLEEAAKHYGATTQFTATQAAEAMQYMALAGWDTERTLAGLPGVLNLAAASGMDLAAASDAITDYISAFGLQAENAAEMADMMAYAQAHSNTSATALADAYGNCAAQMHTAGQDIETTTAMLMLLADQGLKGSEAGTAMSAVMRDITQKMENGAIKIGDTSVAVQDAQGNFRDLNDIMADVEAATAGMGSAAKSAALMETFTARSIKAVGMVMTAGAGKFRDYENALRGAAGTGSEQAGKMMDNLQGDMKLFSSAMEGLQLELYDTVQSIARDFVQGGTEIVQALLEGVQNGFDNASMNKIILSSFDLADAAGKQIRRGIKALPRFFSDIGKLAGPFATHLMKMAGEAVGSFVASLPELLPALLEGFVNLFTGVVNGLGEWYKGIFAAMTGQLDRDEFGRNVSEAIDGVVVDANVDLSVNPEVDKSQAEPEISKTLQQLFSDVTTTLTNGVLADDAEASAAAKEAMNQQVSALSEQINAWETAKINEINQSDMGAEEMAAEIESVKAQAEDMRTALDGAAEGAEQWMTKYSEAPTQVVKDAAGELQAYGLQIEQVETKLNGLYDALSPEALAEATGVGAEKSIGEQIVESIIGNVQFDSISETFLQVGSAIGEAINSGLMLAQITVSDVVDNINNALKGITSDNFLGEATTVAKNVALGITRGIRNITGHFANIAIEIINGLKEALGTITSDVPKLTEAGKEVAGYVFTAIIEGIKSVGNGATRIVQALGGLIGSALEDLNNEEFWAGLGDLGSTIIQGIGESISQGKASAVGVIEAITKAITDNVTPEKIAGAVTNAGNFVKGIFDAIIESMTTAGENDKTLVDSFVEMVGTALSTIGDADVTNALGDFAGKLLTGLGNAIKTAFTSVSGIVDAITKALSGAMAGADGVDIGENIKGLGLQIITALGEGIKSAASGAVTLISSIGELISTLISQAVSESANGDVEGEATAAFSSLGTTIMQALSTALSGAGLDGIFDEKLTAELASTLDSAVSTAQNIATYVGEAIIALQSNGTLGEIWNTAKAIVGDILGIVNEIVEALFGAGEDAGEAFDGAFTLGDDSANGLANAIKIISEALKGMETALGWVKDILGKANEWGILTSAIEGIGSAVAVYFVASKIQSIIDFFKAFSLGSTLLKAANPELLAISAAVGAIISTIMWAKKWVENNELLSGIDVVLPFDPEVAFSTDFLDNTNLEDGLKGRAEDFIGGLDNAISEAFRDGTATQDEIAEIRENFSPEKLTEGWDEQERKALEDAGVFSRIDDIINSAFATPIEEPEMPSLSDVLEGPENDGDVLGGEDYLANMESAVSGLNEAAGAANGFASDISSSAQEAETELNAMSSEIAKSTEGIKESMKATLSEGAGDLGTEFSANFAKGVTSATESVASAANEVVSTTISQIREAISGSGIKSIGTNFARGFANGIRAGKSAIIEAVKEVIKAAIDEANKQQDSGSPSRVTAEIGRWFSQGYAGGITSQSMKVTSAVSDMVHSATDALSMPTRSHRMAYPALAAAGGGIYGGDNESGLDGLVAALRARDEHMIAAISQISENRADQNIYLNGRMVGRAMNRDTAQAQNNLSRRLALGVGRR